MMNQITLYRNVVIIFVANVFQKSMSARYADSITNLKYIDQINIFYVSVLVVYIFKKLKKIYL